MSSIEDQAAKIAREAEAHQQIGEHFIYGKRTPCRDIINLALVLGLKRAAAESRKMCTEYAIGGCKDRRIADVIVSGSPGHDLKWEERFRPMVEDLTESIEDRAAQAERLYNSIIDACGEVKHPYDNIQYQIDNKGLKIWDSLCTHYDFGDCVGPWLRAMLTQCGCDQPK